MDQIYDPEALIDIHLKLECIGLDQEGKLRIPGPDPDDLPRVYTAQFEKQSTRCYKRFYRHDLPAGLCSRLDQLAPDEILHQHSQVLSLLEAHFPSPGFHYGKSYIFPETLSPGDFSEVVLLSQADEPMLQVYDPAMSVKRARIFGLIKDGLIVSTCQSSRENAQAGEAWVRTLPDHRGRGYARQVTAAWAYDLVSRSKIPFYSHKMSNTASEAVAHSLGLIQYITDAAYE